MRVSEYGWVAMHEDGPWHEAKEMPVWWEYAAVPRAISVGVLPCGQYGTWTHWRKKRPSRICKHCLRAKERERHVSS